MIILKILLLIAPILVSCILYTSIKNKKWRTISVVVLFIILALFIDQEIYNLLSWWLVNIGNVINGLCKDWCGGIPLFMLAGLVCAIIYMACMFIVYIWDKNKINKHRDLALATLWLLGWVFGAVAWDIIKDFWEWKIKEILFHFIFLLIFWWLTVYLSNTIEPQKTWSTTSQPTSPHDEENMTSSSQSSES